MGNPETRPGEEGFMNNSEAQEEANMLRVKMGQSAETGEVKTYERMGGNLNIIVETFSREATPEDYTEALQAVEELKKLAKEETDIKKIASMVVRGVNKSVRGLAMGFL